jgi:hypothetical protein
MHTHACSVAPHTSATGGARRHRRACLVVRCRKQLRRQLRPQECRVGHDDDAKWGARANGSECNLYRTSRTRASLALQAIQLLHSHTNTQTHSVSLTHSLTLAECNTRTHAQLWNHAHDDGRRCGLAAVLLFCRWAKKDANSGNVMRPSRSESTWARRLCRLAGSYSAATVAKKRCSSSIYMYGCPC